MTRSISVVKTVRGLVCGLAAVALLVGARPASAQTLGELAQKERERREAAAKSARTPPKVYTNQDLKAPPSPPPNAAPSPTQVKPDGDQPKDASSKEASGKGLQVLKAGQDAKAKDAKDETFWRSKMSVAREELRRNEAFLEALQTRINALSNDFAARDDPAQRAQIADDRQKALAEMERVKSEIDHSTKQIADIEDEARHAGVPPGWLR